MAKPTVGRIVHFQPPRPHEKSALPSPLAALVVGDAPDDELDLVVHRADGSNFPHRARFAEQPEESCCHYPPRAGA